MFAKLCPADVANIERATVAAVAPDAVHTWPLAAQPEASTHWLLPMDRGTVGRAHSAVPLAHQFTPAHAAHTQPIADRYRAAGLAPVFRLPDTASAPSVRPVHQALSQQHFSPHEPTGVQVMATDAMVAALGTQPVRVQAQVGASTQASPAWQALFLGPGMDPVDGAHRVRNLSRAVGTVYVSAELGGQTVACGAASFGWGWMGVHGMRTAQSHRGQGLAAQVLQTMAQLAQQRGIARVFLQVGAANAPALALYQRVGFQPAWGYAYWRGGCGGVSGAGV